MRQIEDARKRYEEIPIPAELSGRSGQQLSGQRKSGKVRGKEYQRSGYAENTGYGEHVQVWQQPLYWYLLRR